MVLWRTGTIALALANILVAGTVLAQGLARSANPPEKVQIPDARKVTFGSNLVVEPCNSCNYDTSSQGYFVLGPDNCLVPGTTQWLAAPFIATATGVPERISASAILYQPSVCSQNKVTLSIYSDACYPTGPKQQLVSGVATVADATCNLTVAKLRNAPTLNKGTKYWVVATTNTQQSALEASWHATNQTQCAINAGAGWQQLPGTTPAFLVQGSETVFSRSRSEIDRSSFGGNLLVDPCTGCNYDPNALGFDVEGPENCTHPGMTNSVAVPFVASKSGIPSRISAALTLSNPGVCPANKVTLSIYTDNCGLGPGAALVSGAATIPTDACALTVAKLRSAPSLTQGTKYWVVAAAGVGQEGLDAQWYDSNGSQFALNNNFQWLQFSSGTPAFLVR